MPGTKRLSIAGGPRRAWPSCRARPAPNRSPFSRISSWPGTNEGGEGVTARHDGNRSQDPRRERLGRTRTIAQARRPPGARAGPRSKHTLRFPHEATHPGHSSPQAADRRPKVFLNVQRKPPKIEAVQGSGGIRSRGQERKAGPEDPPGPGLVPVFHYEKHRTVFRRDRLKVCLDETSLGVFLELEGERSRIIRLVKLLGVKPEDLIKLDYVELFRQAGRGPA